MKLKMENLNIMKDESIFISSGYHSSTAVWIFKFISEFALKKKNNKILFENYQTYLLFVFFFSKYGIKNFNFEVVDKKSHFFTKFFYFIFYITKNINLFFFLIFHDKDDFFKKNLSWKKTQILHSYQDLKNFYMNENNFKKNLICKIKILYSIFNAVEIGKQINKNTNVKYLFFSHPVYQYRATISLLREKNLFIYVLGIFGFYRIAKNFDKDWNFVNRSFFKKICKNKYFIKTSKEYFKNREKGRSSYEGANLSINKQSKSKVFNNYIFLHIFKDSPFRVIDRNRIFVDYFDWIINTLKIVDSSNENWILKIHPSSNRWGENQISLLKKIFKNLKKQGFLLKNILIDNGNNSNISILKKCKKIVTFSGHIATEALAYGLKPIVISHSPFMSINPELICKPKSILEYKKILLDKKIFLRNVNFIDKSKARYLIYIQENLLRFDKDINGFEIYRSDSNARIKKSENFIKKTINKENFFHNHITSLLYNNYSLSNNYKKFIS